MRYRAMNVVICAVALAGSGCDSLIDVENPNQVTDADIRNDQAALGWANGALDALLGAWSAMKGSWSLVSDERSFHGSWRFCNELDLGNLDDLNNECFVNGYNRLAVASWMTREADLVLDSLDGEGELTDRSLMARTRFYRAYALTMVANWMDDFAFSDRTEPGPPVGPENMGRLYDEAVDLLDDALGLPIDTEMRRNLLALRAKARFEQGIWTRVGTLPIDVSGGGLVAAGDAAQDARAALDADPDPDWRFELERPNGGPGYCLHCAQFRMGDRYVDFGDDEIPDGAALIDPIDGVPDPWIERFVLDVLCAGTCQFNVPMTGFSAREMHLIIAEDALARDDLDTFADAINAVRELESLSPWTPAVGVDAREMLIHTRMANLFLMGHRWADLYRFELQADNWLSTSVVVRSPGTFFPIAQSEIDVNCHLNPDINC